MYFQHKMKGSAGILYFSINYVYFQKKVPYLGKIGTFSNFYLAALPLWYFSIVAYNCYFAVQNAKRDFTHPKFFLREYAFALATELNSVTIT